VTVKNMANQDRKQNLEQDLEREVAGRRPSENDYLDRELDAALAKYAAIEPRAGLEDRVLANLRSERERAAARVWWRWPALGAAAAVVLVVAAVTLMWKQGAGRAGNPAPDITAHQPAAAGQGEKRPAMQAATNDVGVPVHPAVPAVVERAAKHAVRPAQVMVADGPRLDQFPSPRPLSDEEKLLVRYVREFPQDAVMIARAQEESEKEMDQLNGSAPSEANQDQR
jgi:hypothetical protein